MTIIVFLFLFPGHCVRGSQIVIAQDKNDKNNK